MTPFKAHISTYCFNELKYLIFKLKQYTNQNKKELMSICMHIFVYMKASVWVYGLILEVPRQKYCKTTNLFKLILCIFCTGPLQERENNILCSKKHWL